MDGFIILWHIEGGAIVGDETGQLRFVANDAIDSIPISEKLRAVEVPRNCEYYSIPTGWHLDGLSVADTKTETAIVGTPAGDYAVRCGFIRDAGIWVKVKDHEPVLLGWVDAVR